MKKAMNKALKEYGRTIKRRGWKAGEPLIEKYSLKFKDFKKWAKALAIVLRTKELLESRKESESDGGCVPSDGREP